VPLGILAVIALMPPSLMDELRVEAAKLAERPVSRTAAVIIVAIWAAAIGGSLLTGWNYLFATKSG
jgi:hypothetical protein